MSLAEYVKTFRNGEDVRVTDLVQRHLLARPKWQGREIRVIHPSDIYPTDWCPRATYLRITTGEVRYNTELRRETIFAEGHEYHRKWQEWLGAIGVLEGLWSCPSCRIAEWSTSAKCPDCAAPWDYAEVPVKYEKYNLHGRADGLLNFDGRRELLEIKSVGIGTIRMYMPDLLYDNTVLREIDGVERKVIDLDAVWRGITEPFSDHVRQANLYGWMLRDTYDLDSYRLLYEFKPDGQTKEFPRAFDLDLGRRIAQRAARVNAAVKASKEPNCLYDGCRKCKVWDE